MPQPRPKCLFCSTAGVSDEHIIPRWIGRLETEDLPPGATYVFHHWSAHPEVGIPLRDKTAKKPAYTSRAFCRDNCNGGWMSRLEDRVRPILEPLMLGAPKTLTLSDQELLAFWATKTLLAFQSIEHEKTKWARAEDYGALYELQAPLPNSQVWLGANRHGEVAWQRAHNFQLPGIASPAVDGFGATLTVGHAVFYLLVGYADRVGLKLRYEAAYALGEIWPSRRAEISWPPAQILPKNPPGGLVALVKANSVVPAKE